MTFSQVASYYSPISRMISRRPVFPRWIRDQVASSAMADRAYVAFLQNWTWDAITPRVWVAAEDCLREKRDV